MVTLQSNRFYGKFMLIYSLHSLENPFELALKLKMRLSSLYQVNTFGEFKIYSSNENIIKSFSPNYRVQSTRIIILHIEVLRMLNFKIKIIIFSTRQWQILEFSLIFSNNFPTRIWKSLLKSIQKSHVNREFQGFSVMFKANLSVINY